MTQSLSPAQQTQLENRDASGQWKQKTHGEPDADADPLGLDSPDPGEAAFGALDPSEQSAWHAWRKMTGKSEETVAGQAKADDIAEFQKHYLGVGFEGDSLPDMEVAQRLGLGPDEEQARHQWDEMVSDGTIEQYKEEDDDVYSFAHPHLARALSAGGGAGYLPAVADDDDELEWEAIEPDFDDYSFSADDAQRMAGLESLQHGEIYWDQDQAYSSASQTGRSGALGFSASGSFADVDTDYLSQDLAERVNRHSGGRELAIANYSNWSSRQQTGEDNQFVSVSLDEAERSAVVDYLEQETGEEFSEELVGFWENGDPQGADDTFGFVSVKREWDSVSDAVRERAPDAAHALETAEDLRRDANSSFESEVEHMHGDEWKKDQAQLRAGLL